MHLLDLFVMTTGVKVDKGEFWHREIGLGQGRKVNYRPEIRYFAI